MRTRGIALLRRLSGTMVRGSQTTTASLSLSVWILTSGSIQVTTRYKETTHKFRLRRYRATLGEYARSRIQRIHFEREP
ncbi:hypothetical protein BDV12DRAFT_142001 [Aspergillus spectabilis]